MYKVLGFCDFCDEFKGSSYENNFTYEGKKALYDYLTDDEMGDGNELDIVALCCEFTEYANLEELQKDYDIESMEELEEKTTVIMINDTSFIIQDF